ncbi:MAG: barstar family protein [Kiritimatiellae bacterium]|nr:barstar family protein [Kiritimatiellia bacterium]
MKKAYVVDLEGKSRYRALQRRFVAAVPVPQGYGCNLDAMYDMLTEYGSEWRIEFRNSANVPEAFRQVCMDAAADTPGLEIAFG